MFASVQHKRELAELRGSFHLIVLTASAIPVVQEDNQPSHTL
jgi:hypothetical protein